MIDEPVGGDPTSPDPNQLVRQLRRAVREQPLAGGGAASEAPGEPVPPPEQERAVHDDEGRSLFDAPDAGMTPADSDPAPAVDPAAAPEMWRQRPSLRRSAAIVSLVVLVAAVPTLGWYGLHLVFATHGGRSVSSVDDPHAAGYLALVTPTPTALVIQVDDANQPVSLTLLSLTMQNKGGGTVVFIPLDTSVPVPAYGIDRLRAAYDRGGATALASAASQVLQIGFSQVVTVDPQKLEALVAPVSPVTVDNPDKVKTPGVSFDEGSIQLAADQVPAYLTARNEGESDLERLNRQSQFWAGWLEAVARSNSSAVVPGEANTGLGHFVRTLARGPVTYETLPVSADTTPLPDGSQLFHADDGAVGKLIALGVPYPVGSGDQRATVRLLNGANGQTIPPGIVQKIVQGGGQISEIGNARKFGASTTEIHYSDPADKKAVDQMRFALGDKAKEVFDETGEDTVKITIVLGSDLIDHPPVPLLAGVSNSD